MITITLEFRITFYQTSKYTWDLCLIVDIVLRTFIRWCCWNEVVRRKWSRFMQISTLILFCSIIFDNKQKIKYVLSSELFYSLRMPRGRLTASVGSFSARISFLVFFPSSLDRFSGSFANLSFCWKSTRYHRGKTLLSFFPFLMSILIVSSTTYIIDSLVCIWRFCLFLAAAIFHHYVFRSGPIKDWQS